MGGHGLPYPKGPMNQDPYMWMRSLNRFVRTVLKHDKGLWLIVGPTALGIAFAGGMIVKKCALDPNIIIPVPWANPNRYETNFDKNTNKLTFPWFVTDQMRDGFTNRYNNLKRPEDID